MTTLLFVESEEGRPVEPSLVAATLARVWGDLQAVAFGDVDAAALGAHGVSTVHRVDLDTYAPQAWGEAVARIAVEVGAGVVAAGGSVRGNEVLAHAAVDLDQPFSANCLRFDPASGGVERIRWGGSLLEEAIIEGAPVVLSVAAHAAEAAPSGGEPARVVAAQVEPSEASLAVRLVDEEQAAEGVTLATARLVVSGGRGVGSAEGFAVLEDLADLLGGKVGCSRVVTNNGWRPHSDQVGQTGTVVAPDLYIACGISGAIQHWVGMMASKQVLSINTDPEAPMMTKADYAVLGDLHEVLPAIVAEVRARLT
jgi:electron transfer flavoprotein alpha subunit